jgi:hypothetical protein
MQGLSDDIIASVVGQAIVYLVAASETYDTRTDGDNGVKACLSAAWPAAYVHTTPEPARLTLGKLLRHALLLHTVLTVRDDITRREPHAGSASGVVRQQ